MTIGQQQPRDLLLGMPVHNYRTDVSVKRINKMLAFEFLVRGENFAIYFALEERKNPV